MRKVVILSMLLAIVVIMLGAYTRLSNAGLGCPDWPGCYGHIGVPQNSADIAAAEQAFPERPVEANKAWIEMIHRYFAGSLGVLILIITVMSFFDKKYNRPIKLSSLILLFVIGQAALGMWTVTMNLMPLVVMGHLLGGFTILSLLFLLFLRLTPYRIPGGDIRARRLTRYTLLGLGILVAQIALGGWTSANYAAVVCTELPICEGAWYEKLDFAGAFSLPQAQSYEYGVHDYAARMTMHITHRLGAVITFIYLCWLAIRLYTSAVSDLLKMQAILLVFVLGAQISLGVSNVVFSLPISVAVLHNIGAALLLLVVILINYTLYRKT